MIPIESLNPMKRVKKDFAKKCHQSELQRNRLIIDLAVRAYELDRGRPANSLNDLVPNYLESVPLDPATGAKLTIHRENRN